MPAEAEAEKPREQLDAEMTDAVLRLQLMPQVGAQRFNTSGHSHPDSRPPPGVGTELGYPEYERLRDEYNAAETDWRREAVLNKALQAIQTWHPQQRELPDLDIEQLVLQDGEGYEAEHVARRFGVATSYIHNIRRRGGVRADDGMPLDTSKLSLGDRRVEVRRLREKNLTVRQIAVIVGVSTYTVSMDIKELQS